MTPRPRALPAGRAATGRMTGPAPCPRPRTGQPTLAVPAPRGAAEVTRCRGLFEAAQRQPRSVHNEPGWVSLVEALDQTAPAWSRPWSTGSAAPTPPPPPDCAASCAGPGRSRRRPPRPRPPPTTPGGTTSRIAAAEHVMLAEPAATTPDPALTFTTPDRRCACDDQPVRPLGAPAMTRPRTHYRGWMLAVVWSRCAACGEVIDEGQWQGLAMVPQVGRRWVHKARAYRLGEARRPDHDRGITPTAGQGAEAVGPRGGAGAGDRVDLLAPGAGGRGPRRDRRARPPGIAACCWCMPGGSARARVASPGWTPGPSSPRPVWVSRSPASGSAPTPMTGPPLRLATRCWSTPAPTWSSRCR